MTSYMKSYMKPGGCSAMVILRFLALALGLMNVSPVAAVPSGIITEQEMALIPPYCPYAQLFPKNLAPERKQWEARLGPGFPSIHHYCWGQINFQRALRSNTSSQDRRFLLGTVISDYEFVIGAVQSQGKDFVLLPEIFTRKGEVELLLARFKDANTSFARARALKPDYWPAYSAWAGFLIRSGHTVEAKQLVQSGLEYSPNSRVLREQYRSLGGNPSDIKPNVKLPTPGSTTDQSGTPVPEGDEVPSVDFHTEPPVGESPHQ